MSWSPNGARTWRGPVLAKRDPPGVRRANPRQDRRGLQFAPKEPPGVRGAGETAVRRGFSTTVKLLVMSALLVLVLCAGAAFAQTLPTATTSPLPSYTPTTPAPTTSPPQTKATTPVKVVQTPPSSGLPRTGSSSSIPTAAVAASMVAVGSVLAIAARRRSHGRRPLG